jgi:hypothetical protein
MLRAEPWVTRDVGRVLAESGCTDVFVGAEALDDEILKVLNKGVTTERVLNAIKALAEFVDVTIGMILFVPAVDQRSLDSQLDRIEGLLPYLHSIEPEVLTVVSGSLFARDPSRYGVILHATENTLNDSWCYGLSPDIPWAMADTRLMDRWFDHVERLQKKCSGYVNEQYWKAVRQLRKGCGHREQRRSNVHITTGGAAM